MSANTSWQRKPLSLVLSLFACSTGVPALSWAADTEIREEIIVTSTRAPRPLSTIPNTISVISEKDLAQQLSINNDLSTVLGNLVPSFSPSRQKLTGSGESLRGRSPLYMIDGVPQSNPLRDGARDGHTIDPLMLQRVEVIHGANAIHGLGASGGIINLITKQPGEGVEQSFRVESVAQTEDAGKSMDRGASYSFSGGFGQADLLASASYRQTGIRYDAKGDVVGFDTAQGELMDTDALNLFLKTGYNWGKQRLELTINHYDIAGNNDWVRVDGDVASGTATTAIRGKVPGEPTSNEVTMTSLQYTRPEFLGHDLRLQMFHQDFAGTFGGGVNAKFQDPAYGTDIYEQSQNNSEKQGVKLTLVKDGVAALPLNLVYGIDVFRDETWQALVHTGRNWVPETNYENYAPYLQAEYSGVERVVLTAGVRYEKSALEVDDFATIYSANGGQHVEGGSPDFSRTLYNAGGTYQFTDQWRLFANYTESFSMPDVGRVLRGIDQPGQSVESFLALKPILTENTELGLAYDHGSLSGQLSYYTSDSDFGQRLHSDADGIYSVERELTEIDGLELRLQWMAGEVDIFGLQYASTDAVFDSDGDGRADSDLGGANVSPDRVNLNWERSWSAGINSRLQVNRLLSRDFKDSTGATAEEFDGYTTVDLNTEVGVMGGQLSFSAQNLTNEDYFTYYSQVRAANTRYFKGIGRTFSLSFQKQF